MKNSKGKVVQSTEPICYQAIDYLKSYDVVNNTTTLHFICEAGKVIQIQIRGDKDDI